MGDKYTQKKNKTEDLKIVSIRSVIKVICNYILHSYMMTIMTNINTF